LNDLKNKNVLLDGFYRKYISFLKDVVSPRRRGRLPRKVVIERNKILRMKGDERPRYFSSSYFSKTPTSHFKEKHYKPAYILLNNEKTALVYKGHPDEKEFTDICKYADPKGEAIDRVFKKLGRKYRVTDYDQVHHNEFIEAIFEERHKTGVFAIEIPVYYYDEATGWLITGHIDTIKIVGKTIYIVDYKPDYTINLKKLDNVATPFFDAVPQLAAYAIMFEKLFHDVLQKHGYEVRCAILNKNNVKLFNPKRALALYTAMFEIVKIGKTPPWRLLISDELVEYYKDLYRKAEENGSI